MKTLVCFYSRSGTTKRAAEAVADELRNRGHDALVEEIIDRKKRSGFFGFLGAARDALFKRKTAIDPVKAQVASFDLVIVATPVWVGRITPAVRTFLAAQAADIKGAAFLCTMGGSGEETALAGMKELSRKEPAATLALRERAVKSDSDDDFRSRVKEFAQQATAH
jgi:menaquinone-dependent protoporphyrinogen IX oxidase